MGERTHVDVQLELARTALDEAATWLYDLQGEPGFFYWGDGSLYGVAPAIDDLAAKVQAAIESRREAGGDG